ncbi:MAG: bifunctional demethylmenaquinone methyltransferase/2-methoxy-6-polyprenyl-1,4-benzoquinol methylase UbiE [Muribaculaceae bacterium]|nr:bifunctional demethylmenaquinone methyltransferase/2-methoxy-6-polyprenyl-1,4-benzoquinol methylase UbiE [Muribaculaceae bacterium]
MERREGSGSTASGGNSFATERGDREERERGESLSGAELVNPYRSDGGKGEQVEEMFDSIAPAYDFMNTAMTLGLHRRWRDKALKAASARISSPENILDIATGTGDVAFRLAELYPDARIKGVDLSEGMLKIAADKLSSMPENIRERVSFEPGDSLALTFGDNSFDIITVAYGVRNFEHLRQGIAEMCRVLRPGGVLCIIELSVPVNPVLKFGYKIYANHVIPAIGRMVSGDSRAYRYLPESIAAAPQRDEMGTILNDCGFEDIKWKSLTLGAVTYYIAQKNV